MPRFFFNLFDKLAPVIDEEGEIFDHPGSASEHAASCAREVMANDILASRPVDLASYISVQDSDGLEIQRVYFGDVITFSADNQFKAGI